MTRPRRKAAAVSVAALAPAAPAAPAPAAGAFLPDERERLLDEIEALLIEKAREGQLTAIMFILKTLGAARGYGVVRNPKPGEDSAAAGLLAGLGGGLGAALTPDQLEAALRAIEDA